ncbi:CRISPR system precrRNA processing endoribonuclease RAMP protein Cas6 [Basilea psittacipulmonis]|uniref:CRISPR-associated protein Cas6 n=1 Tax=Basilea psittacipulmonis DSM 24701 TaxID=1072685 RepID=A0A077DDE5_9BURK|nr:CRISPR system precrRNA processing endoribonuclease RAMP protein Cas6 [Basilea psittacipulmonis]AIL32870.1 CRISPR-associated protein Cas6 [Basilea psittacipulmonis DSM 24701]
MSSELPLNMDIARFRFSFQVTEPISLPEYAGSKLRGAFGRALRMISCMTKQKDCHACPLYRSCPYPQIFEKPAPLEHHLQKFSQVPNAYVIEPSQWGRAHYEVKDILYFDMVLFGRAIFQMPLIAYAWKRAFEREVGHGKAELIDVHYLSPNGNVISIYEEDKIVLPSIETIEMPTPSDKLVLNLHTPLRLQHNGQPLNNTQVTIERFVITLAKRLILLAEFHADQKLEIDFAELKEAIAQLKDEKQLYWKNWTRYSSRQKQTMVLGGLMGTWELSDVSPLIYELIYLGQWLHCGKNATFGLGGYTVTNL